MMQSERQCGFELSVSSLYNQQSGGIMMIQKDEKQSLWKNQRIIGANGLVECEPRERLFDNFECRALMEDLLKIYQQKGLKIHYVQYSLKKAEQNETITYKGYVEYRCFKKDVMEPKKRMVGDFYIHYRIIRITPQTVVCNYPYLLLFDLTCGEEYCEDCEEPHIYKITQSSFYVIRTQFIYELIRKITFMDKYPTYTFTPHNFVSKQSSGETVYEYVKDHNYEPSYYYERCQSSLANLLKIKLMRSDMDCETVRLQLLCQGNPEAIQKHQKKMYKHSAFVKLKYMCRKCPGKEIWTTRDVVSVYFGIHDLEDNFDYRLDTIKPEDKRFVYESSQIQAKYQQIFKKEGVMELANPEQKVSIQKLFNIKDRRLDKSIQKECQEFQQFQKDMAGCYAFHGDIKKYKWPYLIVLSIKIPKMCCHRCQKEKEGLIYITNLVDEAHTILNNKIVNKIKQMAEKKNLSPKKET